MIRFKYWIIIICTLFMRASVHAQINHEILDKPDTLSMLERLSVSTNVLEWSTLQPNISLEYDLRGVTWNRWSIGLKIKASRQTSHTFVPAQVFSVQEARGELRHYWRTRKTSEYYPKNKKIYKKLFSCRRDTLKHPNTTYYRGIYGSASKYSVLLGKTGIQGKAVGVGFLYGIVKPLYQFPNGNALDLDLGISGGFYVMSYYKFQHDRDNNRYVKTGSHGKHFVPFPMLNEARLALVYRFTNSEKHQMPDRYRWRYDVDKEYREAFIAKYKRNQEINDSIATDNRINGVIKNYFDSIYNSIYPNALKEAQEKDKADATAWKFAENAKKEAEKAKVEAEKIAAKEKAAAEKAAENAMKAAEKGRIEAEKKAAVEAAAAEKAAEKAQQEAEKMAAKEAAAAEKAQQEAEKIAAKEAEAAEKAKLKADKIAAAEAAAAEKAAEKARLEAEKIAAKEAAAAEKAQQQAEKIAAKEAAAAEKAAEKAQQEAEKLAAKEKAAEEKAQQEAEKLAAKEKAAAEKAQQEAEKLAAKEKAAAEKAQQEAEKLAAKEKAAADKVNAAEEAAEEKAKKEAEAAAAKEKAAAEKAAEKERKAAEKAKKAAEKAAEKERKAAEKAAEKERKAAEKAAKKAAKEKEKSSKDNEEKGGEE